MININELEELINKQIKLEYGENGRKVTIKELISLAKNGDKRAKELLNETLSRGEDYFRGLEYIINNTIDKQNRKLQKEEERKRNHKKEIQEYIQKMKENKNININVIIDHY